MIIGYYPIKLDRGWDVMLIHEMHIPPQKVWVSVKDIQGFLQALDALKIKRLTDKEYWVDYGGH